MKVARIGGLGAGCISLLLGNGCGAENDAGSGDLEKEPATGTTQVAKATSQSEQQAHGHDDKEEGVLEFPSDLFEYPEGMTKDDFVKVIVFTEEGHATQTAVYATKEDHAAMAELSLAWSKWLRSIPPEERTGARFQDGIEKFRQARGLPPPELKRQLREVMVAHDGNVILEPQQLYHEALNRMVEVHGEDSAVVEFVEEAQGAYQGSFTVTGFSNINATCASHSTDYDYMAFYSTVNFGTLLTCVWGVEVSGGAFAHVTLFDGVRSFVNNDQEVWLLNPNDTTHVEYCDLWETDANCVNCDPRDRYHIEPASWG